MKATIHGNFRAPSLKDIVQIRLANQQLSSNKFNSIKEIVSWMGAMQAQDFVMIKWAAGVRLPQSTLEMFVKSFNEAEIIRTHLLRPTWHLVSSEDLNWMLELTAQQIKAQLKSRHKDLELTEGVIIKSNKLIEKALSVVEMLTRNEIISLLERNKIKTNENRASHLLLCAELDGIICSGPINNNDQTYSLINNRIKQTSKINREEALLKLTTRYFQSHSPATLEDFTWWSGLNVKDARAALESAKPDLFLEKINSVNYYVSKNSKSVADFSEIYLLPSYDEYIISYKDRGAVLPLGNQKKTVSSNGIFKPTVVINGEVKGIWKRIIKKDTVTVEIETFESINRSTKNRIEEAAEKFARFLRKEMRVVYRN